MLFEDFPWLRGIGRIVRQRLDKRKRCPKAALLVCERWVFL
jgi:hypothetical protein